MGNKNHTTFEFNWQSTTPVPFKPNRALSGVTAGVMASTNTIYSNIIDVTIKDNHGLEVTWTGTPTGTLSVMGSASGINFYALTFDPVLAQPAGSASGYLINLNQFPWKYIFIQYVNASGSGLLTVYDCVKDLN